MCVHSDIRAWYVHYPKGMFHLYLKVLSPMKLKHLTAKKKVCAYMTFQKKAAGQNGTPFLYLRLGLLVCSPVTSSL